MNDRKSVRVLIAEDDYLVSKMVGALLEELKYTVVGEAADGLEAVEMTRALQPDVILMDIKMDRMDGIEAARLIQERHPTPVVVLTAYETEELVIEASAAGAGAYLVKPPNTRELERAITIAMARFDDMMALRESNRRLAEMLAELEAAREKVIQQERLAVVGQLAVGFAHEFNNVLAVIALYTNMSLPDPALPLQIRERLGVIAQQTRYATDLVQQLVDFGQRAALDRKTMDVAALLEETLALLERTLPQDIHIELTHECAPPVTINGDPTRIRQAVVNLALNARDAMPKGGQLRIGLGRLRVTEDQDPPLPEMSVGEWIKVTVTDTGTGIPPEALSHIYEPFFTTRAPLGHGLGLPQTYGIVRQHNGHIGLETQVGEGTTFTLYLPALTMRPAESPPPDIAAIPQGRGEVVLVVEDGDALRAALVDSLAGWHYQTLEATSGHEALALMETQGEQVALVLSDVLMPGMDGVALLDALREQGWPTPMILLTGHPMKKKLQVLRDKGLSAWLTKPLSFERLAQAVADALRQ